MLVTGSVNKVSKIHERSSGDVSPFQYEYAKLDANVCDGGMNVEQRMTCRSRSFHFRAATALHTSERSVKRLRGRVAVLTMGDVSRFQRGKQVASYLGLIPREYSSGGHQRFGSISKQGNRFLRMLLGRLHKEQCGVIRDFGMSICIAATRRPKE